jgi:hypothetical protein
MVNRVRFSKESELKSDPLGFGFEVLITYLLPGVVVTLAVAFFHGITVDQAKWLLAEATKAEFLASFLLLAVISALGAVTASVQGVIEGHLLDPLAAQLVGISKVKFDEQWTKYVKDLPNGRNPYIARVVLFFQFETRMGLAMLILSLSLISVSCRHAIFALMCGGLLYAIGVMHHHNLASMRNAAYT